MRVLTAFVMILGTISAYADDDKPMESWFVLSCCSWHSEHGGKNPPRQINPGMGFEYGTKNLRALGGGFINSKSRDSGYIGIRHCWWNVTDKACLGPTAAWVSGYNDRMQFVVVPTLAVEGKEYGMNVLGFYWEHSTVIGFSVKKKF